MAPEAEIKVFPSSDPRLDWVSKHDPRSLNYRARSILPSTVEKRPHQWLQSDFVLDQGWEGACVGFGWTHELIGSPFPDPYVTREVANSYARGFYHECLLNDEYPGEADEGTSVLAGAETARRRGFLDEYRWALGVDDIRDSVISIGPVVIGIPWYSDMYETRPSGLVEVGGDLVGGHCLTIYGYHPSMRIAGEDWHARYEVFRWRNSWGEAYGRGGNGLIRVEDLRDLLKTWGEACVPVTRKKVRLT